MTTTTTHYAIISCLDSNYVFNVAKFCSVLFLLLIVVIVVVFVFVVHSHRYHSCPVLTLAEHAVTVDPRIGRSVDHRGFFSFSFFSNSCVFFLFFPNDYFCFSNFCFFHKLFIKIVFQCFVSTFMRCGRLVCGSFRSIGLFGVRTY